MVINLCSFLDRGNVGNAYAAGLGEDLGITSDDYAWLITTYFIAYICFHWLILVWKVVSPPVFVMCAALGWGTISMLQATATSFATLMVCRFFLGVFEAAFAPGIPLFLSFYYNRREMGLRYGLFFSTGPLSSCFASAMAYGILHARTALQGWQLLFIIEGAPTIILALVAGYVLPKAPNKCRFLTARENEIVSSRAIKGRGQEEEGKLNFKQVFAAFYDYKNYLGAVIIFCFNSSFNSLPAFLPTIIEDIGIGNELTSQGLVAPPNLMAFIVCVIMSTTSDRLGIRGPFICALSCVGGVGYLLLSLIETPGVRYFCTFLILCGGVPASALTFTWVTDNQGSASKRGAGLIIFGVVAQSGSILGAHLFPKSEAPKYVKSMAICAGLLFAGAILTVIFSICLRMQNKWRDEKYGKADPKEVPSDIFDLGDQHPMYRYVV
ncbi:hypothetical protein M409DRAFT_70639 [Zasmidium cellare ATCC 36951]|uniref:Major facilitator superfamily (MFS) profile domain-containing protein n=1 Tax=Zasmidium cellare ATCC 36951 TaxID=1080233 RepID=A0A6A6C2L6_ZASCE|nr:uncharacterized protein M409DRAFT_70639 [Zasmidium cellare ATCC 36951]KAF2160102.1 hypothetical protein M409DRAFT_70639 [Zasmidium cellare ATCC 36951]